MKNAMHEATIRGRVAAELAASQTGTDEARVDLFSSHCRVVDVRVRIVDEEDETVIARETRPVVRVVDADGAVRYGNGGKPLTITALIQEGDNATAAEQRRAAAQSAR